jgi:hypothetical protein
MRQGLGHASSSDAYRRSLAELVLSVSDFDHASGPSVHAALDSNHFPHTDVGLKGTCVYPALIPASDSMRGASLPVSDGLCAWKRALTSAYSDKEQSGACCYREQQAG